MLKPAELGATSPVRTETCWQLLSWLQLSATLRQSLLLHEIKRSLFKPQRPYIGQPIPATLLKDWEGNPRGFLAWLREHTLDLGKS